MDPPFLLLPAFKLVILVISVDWSTTSKICMHDTCMFHTCFMHVSYMQLCLHVCVHVCTQVTCMRVKLACTFACMNHACIEVTCMHVTFVCTFACMKHEMIQLKFSKNADSYMSLTICMHDLSVCMHAVQVSCMYLMHAYIIIMVINCHISTSRSLSITCSGILALQCHYSSQYFTHRH